MSRIEEALQKATVARGSKKASPVPILAQQERTHAFDPVPVERPLVPTNPLVVTVSDPHSPAAEEYRKLKSQVTALLATDSFKNCIMVTSAFMSEGKSITSLNLAITLADELDSTVLLIDGDLRKPSLHTYLGIEQAEGLTECLMGTREVSDSIIRTGIGKLSFLPAGKGMRNPTELISSQRMKDLFADIKHFYHDRYIIIDTPPTLPFTDSRSISTMVDSIIFVVKEGGETKEQLQEALDQLKDGADLLGIVFNEASKSTVSIRYGKYDSRYYDQQGAV